MDALSRLTIENVKLFYIDYIMDGASEQRKVVISIGPDPILNSLDNVTCLKLDSIPTIHSLSKVYPTHDKETLARWFQATFSCTDNVYKAPAKPKIRLDTEEEEEEEQQLESLAIRPRHSEKVEIVVSAEEQPLSLPPTAAPAAEKKKTVIPPDQKWSGLSAYMEHVRKSELEESDFEGEEEEDRKLLLAMRRRSGNLVGAAAAAASGTAAAKKREDMGYDGELA